MEALEEAYASHVPSDDCTASVVKGKRTKRQRLLPPAQSTDAVSSTSSTEFSGSTTEEEEDMANCLILLAQGNPERNIIEETSADAALTNTPAAGKSKSRRFAEAATTTNAKVGFFVYECKTCNKCFPSFQALGGHRASHKKPKLAIPLASPNDENSIQLSMNSFSVQATAAAAASGAGNSKPRIHECSICGAEFTSGQALGGHMRRHRPPTPLEPLREAKKESTGLPLDLNLPAPSEDDHRSGCDLPKSSSAFSFASKTPLLRSTSALVDCHY